MADRFSSPLLFPDSEVAETPVPLEEQEKMVKLLREKSDLVVAFGACATHSLPGRMPLEVSVYNSDGDLVKILKRGG